MENSIKNQLDITSLREVNLNKGFPDFPDVSVYPAFPKDLHFGLCQKLKRAFCFLDVSQKRKSFLVLSASIRENPRLMLCRFNPCPSILSVK